MTTNTTNSQAASIDADPYFCKLLSRIAEFGFTGEHDKALIAYIDAYTAAAVAREREEGRLDGYNKGWADASLTLIKAESRAIAAESRLAEILRGVEGLSRFNLEEEPSLLGTRKMFGVTTMTKQKFCTDGIYMYANSVLALLQPQGQADTSGLPG